MTEIFGIKTKGKDNIIYRSQFEAEFSDRYLHEKKIDYEYEKPYNDGTKSMCDFYIPKWDLYLELVYNPIVDVYAYENKDYIKLNTPFFEKDKVKKLGARWDPEERIWGVYPKQVSKQNLELLHKWMSKEDKRKIGTQKNNKITEDYEEKFEEKIRRNPNKRIIQVNNKHLNSCGSIEDIIRVADNKLFQELYNNRKLQYERHLRVRVNSENHNHDMHTLLCMGYNLLTPSEKENFIRQIRPTTKARKKQFNKKYKIKI